MGTLLTAAVCKPMFAACGLVRCALGTEACISWVTSAKVRGAGGSSPHINRLPRPPRLLAALQPGSRLLTGWRPGRAARRAAGAAARHARVHRLLTPPFPPPLCASCQVLDRSVKGLRETPAKALVGELAAASGDSAAAAFSVRQVRARVRIQPGCGCRPGRAAGCSGAPCCRRSAGAQLLVARLAGWLLPPAHPNLPAAFQPAPTHPSTHPRRSQALSTLGMLVGSALAGLAYKRSGGSYEVTFGLSVVAAALSLALVTTALGADARAGAAARQVEGAPRAGAAAGAAAAVRCWTGCCWPRQLPAGRGAYTHRAPYVHALVSLRSQHPPTRPHTPAHPLQPLPTQQPPWPAWTRRASRCG